MTSFWPLILGLAFVFGMLFFVFHLIETDTSPVVPADRTPSPVQLVGYNDRVRRMQAQAAALLEEEPLRGYTRLWMTLWGWIGPAQEDDTEPIGGRILGPQDPTREVPRRSRL